jgi:hypothetical protein
LKYLRPEPPLRFCDGTIAGKKIEWYGKTRTNKGIFAAGADDLVIVMQLSIAVRRDGQE